MDDQAFYDQAASEIRERQVIRGVWAQAFAESEGDANRTMARYIALRVQQLKDAAAHAKRASVPPVPVKAPWWQRGLQFLGVIAVVKVLGPLSGILAIVGYTLAKPRIGGLNALLISCVVGVGASVVFSGLLSGGLGSEPSGLRDKESSRPSVSSTTEAKENPFDKFDAPTPLRPATPGQPGLTAEQYLDSETPSDRNAILKKVVESYNTNLPRMEGNELRHERVKVGLGPSIVHEVTLVNYPRAGQNPVVFFSSGTPSYAEVSQAILKNACVDETNRLLIAAGVPVVFRYNNMHGSSLFDVTATVESCRGVLR